MTVMSQDLPDLPDILRTVREYLEGIADAVPDRERYHALCCIHLLSIAEREVTAPAAIEAAELKSISAFLGESVEAEHALSTLAHRIRSGHTDARWEAAFDLVMQQVVNKVSVTKPEHLALVHRRSGDGIHQD